VAAAVAPQKYVVCNADEGDSGTFSDRMTMEGDPFMLIEGMTIAALAGRTNYIYVRSNTRTPWALNEAIARATGWIGRSVGTEGLSLSAQGRGLLRAVKKRPCSSIEGKRGVCAPSRPFPRSRACSASPR
jgi:formate dehydrogenase iron-sulfur subunit